VLLSYFCVEIFLIKRKDNFFITGPAVDNSIDNNNSGQQVPGCLSFSGCYSLLASAVLSIDIFKFAEMFADDCMKKILFVIAFLLVPGIMQAQDGGTGLGIILGEPAGVSFKTWISGRSAIDAGLAWSFYTGSFHSHADYIWHNFMLFKFEEGKGKLPLYMGVGGRIKVSGKELLLGVRVPIGLIYIFPGDRFDIFLEAVPVLNLIPGTSFDLNAGVGVRYFFIKNRH
jgi:hypothetical protein